MWKTCALVSWQLTTLKHVWHTLHYKSDTQALVHTRVDQHIATQPLSYPHTLCGWVYTVTTSWYYTKSAGPRLWSSCSPMMVIFRHSSSSTVELPTMDLPTQQYRPDWACSPGTNRSIWAENAVSLSVLVVPSSPWVGGGSAESAVVGVRQLKMAEWLARPEQVKLRASP